MRKGITSSVFILLLVVFSGTVLAGDKSECDKYGKKELQKLGVYGLCVAYYNADESARQGIADKFEDQAGFQVPGTSTQDFDCPCWADLKFIDICEMDAPVKPNIVELNGLVVFGHVRFQHAYGTDNFITNGENCVHTANDPDGYLLGRNDNNNEPLDEDESIDCLSEIAEIRIMNESEYCLSQDF